MDHVAHTQGVEEPPAVDIRVEAEEQIAPLEEPDDEPLAGSPVPSSPTLPQTNPPPFYPHLYMGPLASRLEGDVDPVPLTDSDLLRGFREDDILINRAPSSRSVLDMADLWMHVLTPPAPRSVSASFPLSASGNLAHRRRHDVAHTLDQAGQSLHAMSLAQLTGMNVTPAEVVETHGSEEAGVGGSNHAIVSPDAPTSTSLDANAPAPRIEVLRADVSTQTIPTIIFDEASEDEMSAEDEDGRREPARIQSAPPILPTAVLTLEERFNQQRQSRWRLQRLYLRPSRVSLRTRSASPRIFRRRSEDRHVEERTQAAEPRQTDEQHQDSPSSGGVPAQRASRTSPFVTEAGVELQGTAMSSTFATPLSPLTPSRLGGPRRGRGRQPSPRRRAQVDEGDRRHWIFRSAQSMGVNPEQLLFVHALHALYTTALDLNGPVQQIYEESRSHYLFFDVADQVFHQERGLHCYQRMRGILFLRGIAAFHAAVEHDSLRQSEARFIECLTAGFLRDLDKDLPPRRPGSPHRQHRESFFDWLIDGFCERCLDRDMPSQDKASVKIHRIAKHGLACAIQEETLDPLREAIHSKYHFDTRLALEVREARSEGFDMTDDVAKERYTDCTIDSFLDKCPTHYDRELVPKAAYDDDPDCKTHWYTKIKYKKHTRLIAPDTERIAQTYWERADFKKHAIIGGRSTASAMPCKVFTSRTYSWA